jgi:HEAT repeat protein
MQFLRNFIGLYALVTMWVVCSHLLVGQYLPPANEAKKDEKTEPAKQDNNAPAPIQSKAEEEIAQLKAESTSLPRLQDIVTAAPTLPVVEAAMQFLSNLGPNEETVVIALVNFAIHSDKNISGKALELLGNANWLANLRLLLRSDDLDVKRKVAKILRERGKIEIPVFLELLLSPNETNQEIAEDALSQIGTDAIIPLIALVEKRTADKTLAKDCQQILQTLGLPGIPIILSKIKNTQPEVGRLLLESLVNMGKPAIPEAIHIFRLDQSRELKEVLQEMLKRLGPSAIPDILPLVSEPAPIVQSLAEELIKEWSAQALPYIMDIFQNSKDDETKKSLLRILATIGPEASKVLPTIKPLLAPNNPLQYSALYAVRAMGEACKEVIPELQAAFQSKDSAIRSEAAYALANVGVAGKNMLPLFLERLGNEEAVVKIALCKAIGSLGTLAKNAVPKLVAILEDEYSDEAMIRAAAEALGNIGAVAKDAINPLLNVFTYSYIGAKEREVVAIALAKIGKEAIPKLASTLRFGEYREAREGSAIALGYMKISERRVIDPLTAALRFDQQDMVRVAAALSLGNIREIPSDSIRALLEAARSENSMVREAASKALGKLGKEVVPYIIIELRRSSDPVLRPTLIHTLGEIQSNMPEVPDFLMESFPAAPLEERKEIIQALGNIGDKAKKALPMFLEVLRNEEDEEIHKLLRETVINFGEESIPEVISLLKQDREMTRKSAFYILQKFGSVAVPYLSREIAPDKEESLLIGILQILQEDPNADEIALRVLSYDSEKVRNAAVRILTKMGARAVSRLIERLKHLQNPNELQAITTTLTMIGAPSVPSLIKLMLDAQNKEMQKIAIDVVASIGPGAEVAINPLIELLLKAEGNEQVYLAKTLGKIGKSAIPHLVRLLDKDERVRKAIVMALGETSASESIYYLLQALQKPALLPLVIDTMVKMQEIAVPLLIQEIGDKNPHVRFACAAALLEIAEPQAISALEAQIQAEKDVMVKYMLMAALRAAQKKVK